MIYIVPHDVTSPISRWRLREVLYDGGEGEWFAAEGQWDFDGRWRDVLALRWNGREGAELGNPQSSARPTWFIVPDDLEAPVREALDRIRGAD